MKGVITLKRSERSLQFKKNYLAMREDGKTVREIADFYGLSHSYPYDLLRELAEELGVKYKSLINQPHQPPIYLGPGKEVEPVKPVDFSAFQQEFRGTISQLDKTIYQMEKVLKEWPEVPADLKEV